MTRWHTVRQRAGDVGRQAGKVYRRLAPWNRDTPLMVEDYLGYGTSDRVRIMGRVLHDRGIREADADDSSFSNFWSVVQRFRTDEFSDAHIEARFPGSAAGPVSLSTNKEGHFAEWLDLPDDVRPGPGGRVRVSLRVSHPSQKDPVDKVVEAIVPPPDARFGIISDLDDTVLQTGTQSRMTMLRNTLFRNAFTRVPFPGVAALYEGLVDGRNPIFYVSHSPWNLYTFVAHFLAVHDVPAGPILLRDWGFRPRDLSFTGSRTHKPDVIAALMDAYPELDFLLLGDSSENDPEFYLEATRAHPGRVKVIYIRNHQPDDLAKAEAVAEVATRVAEAGSELVFTVPSDEMALDAVRRGLLAPEWVDRVRSVRSFDRHGGDPEA